MAKTTKAPAKRANSKQNKNSKQVGIFGKSFDLKSRKVQFFVSIFIIAILGGGYFTFRSFAATTKTWSIGGAAAVDRRYGKSKNVQSIEERDRNAGKGNARIASLNARTGVLAAEAKNCQLQGCNSFLAAYPKKYQICVLALPVNGSTTMTVQAINIGKTMPGSYKTFNLTRTQTKYTNFCTNAFKGNSIRPVIIQINNTGGSIIHVGSMQIKEL